MADEISFADMGKALDEAASQYQDTNATTEPDTQSSDAGDTGASTEGNNDTPQGASGDANLPKTESTPVGDGDKQGSLNNGKSATADDKQASKRKAFNHAQASARIARKRAREQKEYYERVQRLTKERDAYADENGKYHNPQMAELKNDQIREAEIAEAKRLQDEFTEDAYNTFQDEATTQQFIQDCKTYADWINTKEPQLSEYIRKPYGKLVLKGWFDKVAKNPNAADWWESLTPFEKYKTLDRYYNQFSDYIAKIQRGETVTDGTQVQTEQSTQTQQTTQQTPNPAPAVANAPVPGSGRNTNAMPPTNNFALELEQAMQANNVSRLVR